MLRVAGRGWIPRPLRRAGFSPKVALADHAVFRAPGRGGGDLQIIGGLRLPNPLGLYDLYGNVEELMLEPFRLNANGRSHGQPGGLVTRGGSADLEEAQIYTARRSEYPMFSSITGRALASEFFGVRFVLSAIVVSEDRLIRISEDWNAEANRDLEAGAEARAGLQAQLAERDAEIRAVADEIGLLKERLSEEQALSLWLEVELRAAIEEIATLRAAGDVARARLAAANRDLEAGAEARAELQSLLADRAEEIGTVAGEMEVLEERLFQEQARALRLEAGLRAANEEILRLQAARDDAESRLAEASRALELGATERSELESQLTGKDAEYQSAIADIERQQVQLEEVRTSLAQAEEDNQDIRSQLDRSREEGWAAVEESSRLSEVVSERDRRIAILSQEREQGNILLEGTRSQIEAATELRSLLEATKRELQQSLERVEEELAAKEDEIRVVASEMAFLRERLAEAQALTLQQEVRLKTANEEIAALRSAGDDAQARLAGANRDLEVSAQTSARHQSHVASGKTKFGLLPARWNS